MKKRTRFAIVLGALVLTLGLGVVTYGSVNGDPPFTLINLR